MALNCLALFQLSLLLAFHSAKWQSPSTSESLNILKVIWQSYYNSLSLWDSLSSLFECWPEVSPSQITIPNASLSLLASVIVLTNALSSFCPVLVWQMKRVAISASTKKIIQTYLCLKYHFFSILFSLFFINHSSIVIKAIIIYYPESCNLTDGFYIH